ncbi:MAG TPA: sialidase family protein [Actinomycetota bacterium]|nr:sialidase family protein [Actinomycetota bacterium]
MKAVFRVLALLVAALVTVILIPGRAARDRSVNPRAVVPATSTRISGLSQFGACPAGRERDSVGYTNSEVEPHGAVNPRDPSNMVATWQQDRWSDGGARALPVAWTKDGGRTWSMSGLTDGPRVNLCSGGTAENGGDYERASDPWVSFAPNGDLYHSSLAFNRSNDRNAVLISKSTDGGKTWADPVTVREDRRAFNDKETVTADPLTDPRQRESKAYAVWSRDGNAWFARTTDGTTWDRAKPIFRDGFSVAHQIVVHESGQLVDIFSLFKSRDRSYIAVIRSTDGGPDRGDSWSDATIVSRIRFASPRDPDGNAKIRAGEGIPDIAADPQTGDLYAVWQDLLFDGERKRYAGILFSISRDAGRTWSKPVRINQPATALRDANDQAIIPTVEVGGDGTVAVSYYDFRQNTDAERVSTDHWLVRCPARTVSCVERSNWSETHVAGPFDIEIAPKSMGLFLGDYMGLAAAGRRFVLFFVQSSVITSNRTNVFVRRI